MKRTLLKRTLSLTLGLAAAAAIAATGPATAQVNLTYANGYARTHAQVGVVADEWIARIDKATNGRVKIRHVFGGSLIKPEAMIEGLRGRIADMGSGVVSFFPGQLPISATLAGSSDLELGNKLDMKGLTAITMRLVAEFPEFAAEYEKLGLKVLFWVPSPPYGIITKTEVKTLDDFRGKKIRTFGNVVPQLVNAVGGVPLSVAFGEIYTSLQTGVLDGALTDPPAMLTGRFDEVAKFTVLTGPQLGASQLIAPVAYIANLDSWNRIPAADRAIIEKVNQDIITFGANLMISEAHTAIATLQARGVTINRLSQAQADDWRARAPDFMKLAAENITKAGAPGERMMARYRQLADDYISGKWKP